MGLYTKKVDIGTTETNIQISTSSFTYVYIFFNSNATFYLSQKSGEITSGDEYVEIAKEFQILPIEFAQTEANDINLYLASDTASQTLHILVTSASPITISVT